MKPNFITDIIDGDLESGRHQTVTTRFPPEPNGYLHIGHVKSICLNFGLADKFGGKCHLRFDDTNPTTEDVEYVESMKRDIAWLGFDWNDHLYYASDYYDRLYDHAVELIDKGLAYVCELSEEKVREYRGTVTEAGKNSPFRDRPPAESRALFEKMRAGEIDEGKAVVRAKIDMASPNMKMRDPPIYRIKNAHHYRTGDKWVVYPLYDFTHCLSDAYEAITHSICTLEFENNRELYDWVLANVTLETKPLPRQYEFARLALNYTMTSKRKLLQLVSEGLVSGWDDPRMPTVAGMRRRGYTPEALRAFCDMIGVAKANSTVDVGKLEYCIRDDLNQRSPRVMCVLDPLKVVIEGVEEAELEAPFFPPDVGKPGSRKVPLTREIFIERSDFSEDPPKGFKRLAPGRLVRLRYAQFIACDGYDKKEDVLRCTYVKTPTEKVAGTIHWVSADKSLPCTVRLYDRLFNVEAPESVEDLNPDSLKTLTGCRIEPAAKDAGDRFQFERQGYFLRDDVDSKPDQLVFNRTITLRDTWAKTQKAPAPKPKKAKPKVSQPAAKKVEPLTDEQKALVALGAAEDDARRLAGSPAEGLFRDAAAKSEHAAAVAKWIVNEVARHDFDKLTGGNLAALVGLVEAGTINGTAGKEVLAEMLKSGAKAEDIVAEKGLEQIGGDDELGPVVDAILEANPEPVQRYKDGNKKLIGFFVGQVMRQTKGRADAGAVKKLLASKLDG